jgi:folate-binding protein YgfZ
MEGDVWITATADALWLDAPLELRETLGPRLERYIIADDVVMEDQSESVTGFHVIGTPRETQPSAVSSSRFGQPGFDYWSPGPLETALPLATPPVVEALRIRQGIPLWGHEMSPQTLPPEAALDRDAISYSKGCYIGQEVIARIKSKGHVNKKLARILGDGNAPGSLPIPLFQNSKEGGTLTSACFDPEGPGWIGLGIVKREWAELGASFPLDDQTITVHPL